MPKCFIKLIGQWTVPTQLGPSDGIQKKNSADARHLLSLAAVNLLLKGTVQRDGSGQN
jgi:hypothetical protein